MARKLRVVDSSDLAEMLDQAVDAGQLIDAERDAILAADLVLRAANVAKTVQTRTL